MHGQFLPRTHAATFSGISLWDQLILGRLYYQQNKTVNSIIVVYMNM